MITATDSQNRVTATSYDSLGRRTATQQGTTSQLTAGTLPATGSWTYDSDGNILTSTDGANGTTTYTRDDAGRTLTVKDPLNRTTSLAYDTDGNPVTLTRPGASGTSIITTRAYNAAGQLTGIDYPTGTADISYSYDKTGLRTSRTDGTGTTTSTYNSRGQLTGTTKGTTVVGFGYDAAGRQTSITYPGSSHTLTRAFDNADRLTSVTDWTNSTATYTWNTDSTAATATLPNGVGSIYTYDKTALTTKIVTAKGATTISDLRYTYNTSSLLTAVSDMTTPSTPVNHGYTWDTRARLDTATGASNAGDYDYDGADRLKTALASTLTVDAAGQLSTSSTTAVGSTPAKAATYTYNTLGDRTQTVTTPTGGTATTKTYGYNAADQLTSYTDTAITGTSIGYTYTGDGLRAAKTRTVTGTGTTTSAYVWDTSGDLPVLISDGDNYYFYGPDNHPYAQQNIATGTTTYLHADPAGSTIATTSSTGTRTGTWEYDPYGNISARTGTAVTPFLYDGEYRDTDTGLTYLRARDYDPATGSFTTRDPLENLTATPYAYTGGNPLQNADPTGLFWGGVGGFIQDHWRTAAKIAVVAAVGIAAGACIAASGGLCLGFSPLLTTAVVGAIGAVGGAVDYALTDTCHTWTGFAGHAALGSITTLAGEGLGYAATRTLIARSASEVAEVAGNAGALVKYDPMRASRNLLGQVGDGYAVTPGGRTISAHAADRIVNGAAGRSPTSLSRVDDILDNPTKAPVYRASNDAVRVSQGKDWVAVSGTGPQHIVTVMIR